MSNPQPRPNGKWFEYFKFDRKKDSPKDVRDVLLVVVALIAAVTFQAGINPPRGIWQDDKPLRSAQPGERVHEAGYAILASTPGLFTAFLAVNTAALSISLTIIFYLTKGFPLRVELVIAEVAMFVGYLISIIAITPDGQFDHELFFLTGILPPIARVLWEFFEHEDET